MEERRPTKGSGSALLSDAASPAQLRVDVWNRVREGVERLAGRKRNAERSELESQFRRLEEVERLWAYPGPARIELAQRLYRAEDWTQLRALVGKVVNRLSADGDRAALAGEHHAAAHYFTVLLVDSMSAEQLQAMRERLRELRASGRGDLVYEVVQVGSFEEAWLAVMCNSRHPGGGDVGTSSPSAPSGPSRRRGSGPCSTRCWLRWGGPRCPSATRWRARSTTCGPSWISICSATSR